MRHAVPIGDRNGTRPSIGQAGSENGVLVPFVRTPVTITCSIPLSSLVLGRVTDRTIGIGSIGNRTVPLIPSATERRE